MLTRLTRLMLMAKWTYERQANAYGEATLAEKLNTHGKASV